MPGKIIGKFCIFHIEHNNKPGLSQLLAQIFKALAAATLGHSFFFAQVAFVPAHITGRLDASLILVLKQILEELRSRSARASGGSCKR